MAIVAPAKEVGRTVVSWDPGAAEPLQAVRALTGVAVVLGVATVLGLPSWTPVVLTGVWSGGIPLLAPGVRPRPTLPLYTGAAIAVAVMLGGLAGPSPTLTIIVSVVWAMAMAVVGSLGNTASVVSTACGVALVLGPNLVGDLNVFVAGLAALAGGAVQSLAAVLPPWRRYRSEAQHLGDALRALAVDANVLADTMDVPLSTEALHRARVAMDKRRRLPDAMRESIGALYELRSAIVATASARSRLVDTDPTAARHTAAVLRNTTVALDIIADAVERLEPISRSWEERLAGAIDAGPVPGADSDTPRHAVAGQEIRRLHRAVHRSARLAERVIDSEPPTTEVSRRVRARSQAAEHWQTLRANLPLGSPTMRHAVRSAVTIAVATAAGWFWPAGHGYWLPLTAWIVLRPDFAATIGKGLARMVGTGIGGWLAALLSPLVGPDNRWTSVVVVGYAGLAYLTMPVSFVIYSVALAGFSVFQVDLAGQSAIAAAGERGLATVVGGGIALLLYVMWPTWHTRQLPEMLADLIEAYRKYANLILDIQARPTDHDSREIQSVIDEVRLKRAELTEATNKAAAEPIGGPPPYSTDVEDVAAALSRAVRALIVLEGNIRHTDAAHLPGIDEFRDAIDAAFGRLAAWVRTGMTRQQVDLTGALADLDAALEHGTEATLRRRQLLDWETDIIVESLIDANLIIAEWGRA